MIRVRVTIQGALAKPNGKSDFTLELTDDASVERLLLSAGYQPSHLRFIVPGVNGERVPLGHALRDGDEVTLVLPTSGG